MPKPSRRRQAYPLLLVVLGLGDCARPVPQPAGPPMSVEMERGLLNEFYEEIQEYVRLRKSVADKVPPVKPDATAEEIAVYQKAMTDAIIAYRKEARQGEIFEPDIERAFRRIVAREVAGPEGPAILKDLRAGNPTLEGVPQSRNPTRETKTAPVALRINGYYPEGAPFSSVPPSLLLKLPQLPDQVRYRFVGRALILRDTEANIILDYITEIVPDASIPR